MRINLFLAKALGISRRSADSYLEKEKIRVNGEVASTGQQIDLKTDKITLDGKTLYLNDPNKTTIALYKPRKCITTRNDPQKRQTVIDLLPKELKKLKPIGRLDYDSEGLLLLSDDGELIYRLTHPKFEKEKEYILELKDNISEDLIKDFKKGIMLKEGLAKADEVKKMSDKKISVILHQGYNRQLRRMTELCGNEVTRLKRIRMGEVKLGDLKPGEWKEVYKN